MITMSMNNGLLSNLFIEVIPHDDGKDRSDRGVYREHIFLSCLRICTFRARSEFSKFVMFLSSSNRSSSSRGLVAGTGHLCGVASITRFAIEITADTTLTLLNACNSHLANKCDSRQKNHKHRERGYHLRHSSLIRLHVSITVAFDLVPTSRYRG